MKLSDSPTTSSSLHRIAVERGVCQREVLGVLTEQLWEDRLSLVTNDVLVDVAVHEPVHECRVGVDVDVEIKIDVLQRIVNN